MPFSFAHPLAVVPLARTAMPFSALVVGSMSPDFQYVILLKQSSHSTHSLPALFSFCLPASLIVLALWHGLLKRPLLELLPSRQQRVLHPLCHSFPFGPLKRFLHICLAIIIGAATHIIWDSFTHPWGWPVEKFPALKAIALSTSFQEFPVYKLLQYASSLLGTALVLFLYWRWQRTQTGDASYTPRFPSRIRITIAGAVFLSAATVAAIWSARLFPPTASFDNFKAFIVRSIVVGTAVIGIELFLYAIWFRLLPRPRNGPPTRTTVKDPTGSIPSD